MPSVQRRAGPDVIDDPLVQTDPVAAVLALPRGEAGHARYEQVRARGTLVRGRGRTLMTASHTVCGEVLRSPDFAAVATTVDPLVLDPFGAGPRLAHPLNDSFASIDPPEHGRLRKIVAAAFTQRALRELTPFVEQVTAEHLDRLDPDAIVDLIGQFALRVPSAVICRLLGLPTTDHDRFVHWGLEFSAVVDGARTAEDLHRTRVLLGEMGEYFRHQMQRRRREPGDDLVSVLVAALDDGQMTEIGALATCESLLIGGFVTTSNIIGNAVVALLAHPAQLDEFVAEPDLAPALVEEVLRLEAPAQYSVRVARTRVSLAGQTVPAGTPVITLLAAANRDPAVFDHPTRLDIFRPNARMHLSFAAGVHYCIGAGLARLEGAVALSQLFGRFPDLSLSARPVYCASRVIRGPRQLMVRLR